MDGDEISRSRQNAATMKSNTKEVKLSPFAAAANVEIWRSFCLTSFDLDVNGEKRTCIQIRT